MERRIRWRRRLLTPFRIVRARPRLSVSLMSAVVIALSLPAVFRVATRLLIGWNLGVALYLALAYHLVATSDVGRIRIRARIEDEGAIAILVLTATAAFASFAAIIAELGSSSGTPKPPGHLLLATLTIVMSWVFTHTIFALHYAHEFYQDEAGGGLAFPGSERPDYWDFVYFSFVIGMTSQVSDVAITTKRIRRTATAHGIVSFAFNAALLALTVNIAASAI